MPQWVKCPRDGHTWQTKSTLPHVTCPYCGYKIEREANRIRDDFANMEHFNLDENGVRILDKNLVPNRIVDVFFKRGKAWCEYDDSSDCKHVEFALSLPVVQEILKKKGWR